MGCQWRFPHAPLPGRARRQKLVVEETQHLRAVLEHPAFVADPFAALQEHLQNTVAPPIQPGEKGEFKKKKGGKK